MSDLPEFEDDCVGRLPDLPEDAYAPLSVVLDVEFDDEDEA